MNRACNIQRPALVRHVRYRWDELRREHQLVFPEGVLVLNETGAAIVKLCDGRPLVAMIAELQRQFSNENPADDVDEFIERLAEKGLVRDAAGS